MIHWKSWAKWVRSTQPFNWLATSLARSVMWALGRQSEVLIRHLHRAGGVCAALPNGRTLRLWSRGDDWISNQVFWRGWTAHEPETATLFFRLAAEANATIDVGAYVGYYALLAAHANPFGRVIALEPLPAIHARLVRHVELNGLKNVNCLMAAAGAREGLADFYHQPHELPTSSSLSHRFMARVPEVVSTRVSVVALDRVVRDHRIPRVDLVKIDTESTEPEVLTGMRETLARDRPSIICEVLRGGGAEERLAPLLDAYGYRYYLLTSDGLSLRSRIEGDPVWLNYLFAARLLPQFAVFSQP